LVQEIEDRGAAKVKKFTPLGGKSATGDAKGRMHEWWESRLDGKRTRGGKELRGDWYGSGRVERLRVMTAK